MPDFKDFFSRNSEAYQEYRPTYPQNLFSYLSDQTREHDLAWDCGTGNGQCVADLAKHYFSVYASDPSAAQIRNAKPYERVKYSVEKAENCSLEAGTVDLITVAQALHWFDFDEFYAVVNRVLKPGGLIAAWAYDLPVISPEIDKMITHFHDEVVGEFWQYENRLIMDGYARIPFPFREISVPAFTMDKLLSLNDLLGLIGTWSAVRRFTDKNGINPVPQLKQDLLPFWGNRDSAKLCSWQLTLKAGRKS